jgi:hypothetical protein
VHFAGFVLLFLAPLVAAGSAGNITSQLTCSPITSVAVNVKMFVFGGGVNVALLLKRLIMYVQFVDYDKFVSLSALVFYQVDTQVGLIPVEL